MATYWYRVEFSLEYKGGSALEKNKSINRATEFTYSSNDNGDISKDLMKEAWRHITSLLDGYIESNELATYKLNSIHILNIYKLIYHNHHNKNGFYIQNITY